MILPFTLLVQNPPFESFTKEDHFEALEGRPRPGVSKEDRVPPGRLLESTHDQESVGPSSSVVEPGVSKEGVRNTVGERTENFGNY